MVAAARPTSPARAVRGLAVAGAAALAATSLITGPGRATAGAVPDHHPSRLRAVSGSAQVVVVTSARWSSRRGVLRAYELRPDGSWRRVIDAGRVWLGHYGFATADRRRQGSSTTPAGTFGLLRAFGTRPDPGTALDYRRADATDWWPYDPRDPATYNVWQTRRTEAADWRMSWAEDLSSFGRQYRYAAVVDFNLPSGVHRSGGEWVAARPADTRRGGAIFLHVQARQWADRPTAGCVAMRQRRMLRLLRWLDPTAGPVVVMGPRAVIDRM